jgi:hypothetical protein
MFYKFVCSIAPTLLHQTIQFVATTSTRSTRSVVVVVAAAAAASTRFASRFSLEAHTEEERDPVSDTQKSPLGTAASLLVLLHFKIFDMRKERERERELWTNCLSVSPSLLLLQSRLYAR